MSLKKLLSKNKLSVAVIAAYSILALWMPEKAMHAANNSVYYLIEMMMVMPVIFLLTVAIEVLIPKAVISKHFGNDSGLKGNAYALLIGSISAGPIYAAFPICKMLLQKGASVSNLLIILSAWAVIKLPMLANEAKFLGLTFMTLRWVLTVGAILLMAWIAGKLISISDLPVIEENDTVLKKKRSLNVSHTYCIGCGICSKILPEVFFMTNKKAHIQPNVNLDEHGPILNKAIESCPVRAIV